MNRSKREQQEFSRKRKVVIAQLRQLERRVGVELARSAMRKHLELVREEDVRVRRIAQLQDELDVIRRKR